MEGKERKRVDVRCCVWESKEEKLGVEKEIKGTSEQIKEEESARK